MSDLTLPSQVVPSRWMRIVPILLLHALTLLLVSVVLCSLVPGLQEYYRHANLEIPAATLSVIQLSDRLVKFWLPVFCLIMISDFLLMFVLTSLKPSRRWPLSAYSQIFVFCALVLAVYVAAWSANPIIWSVP